MRNIQLLLAATVLSFSALIAVSAEASTTAFSSRPDWEAAVLPLAPTTIDFATTDDGLPISNPIADVYLSSLTLRGVTFLDIRSFRNASIYTAPAAVIRINLAANTNSFGLDFRPIVTELPGTFSILLSTGDRFQAPAGFGPTPWSFFGAVSTTPIEWIEISLNSTYLMIDNFSFTVLNPIKQVAIDIVPGLSGNPILLKPGTLIPVAILSSPTFSALDVDVATVRFGLVGTEAPAVKDTYYDVNSDGLKDLVVIFRSEQTALLCGATSAKLTGKTVAGAKFAGSDLVKTMNCKPN